MCSGKEMKSHPGTKLLISEGAVISSRGDTMGRPGAMELWSPPRRDNQLIKIGLLFPRYSIVVWTYLIYNYRQWVSCPDCNTPIALGLPLPLLSRPSLGQLSGPLITWEHRNALKDGGICTFRAIYASAACTSPLWDTSKGPGLAELVCQNLGIYSTQTYVSTTRKQRGTALYKVAFCTQHLVFAHSPDEARYSGSWKTPCFWVTLEARHAIRQGYTLPLRFNALRSPF